MKTSHCHEQAQGLLFDITSDHNRELDELDYCAMPCGAAKTARLNRRVCLPRCVRVLRPNNGSRMLWLQVMLAWSNSRMVVPYWYLAPLSQVLHSYQQLLWKEVTIAQPWSAHSEWHRT